jgi:hypothetical protein
MAQAELRAASISDIHLGHRRTPTGEIITNLYKAFPDDAETAALDIIFIVGDVFDDLLSLNNEEVTEIDLWIANFLRLCAKHDIVVLIVEGTPSHDWQQSRRFVVMNEAARIGADLTYVKNLSIQYIERLGITVLCVPDEANPTNDRTLEQVQELMKAKGLTQVDYALMHGQFPHQLPAAAHKAPVHDPDAYLALVRYLIFIGHVHFFSHYRRIIAQGSFDRLAQGEEGPKGHVRALVRGLDDYDISFVENTGAKRYVTVNCLGLGLEETIAQVDEYVLDLPVGSYVRVRSEHTNTIFTNMEMLIRRYPLLNWSKDAVSPDEDKTAVVEDEVLYVPITLTRENLGGLLMQRIVNAGARAEVLKAAEELIEEAL